MSKVNMAVELSKSSVDAAEWFEPRSEIDEEAVEYSSHGCPKTHRVCEAIQNKFAKCDVGLLLHYIGGPSGNWVGVLPTSPAKSLFYTALICYIPAEDTYLIQSLRINRDRDIPYKYDKCSDYSLRTRSVVAKRPEKVASIVAGFSPFLDDEVSKANVDRYLRPALLEDMGSEKTELAQAFRTFRWPLDNESYALDVITLLEAAVAGRVADLGVANVLMPHYKNYLDKKAKAMANGSPDANSVTMVYLHGDTTAADSKYINMVTETPDDNIRSYVFEDFEKLPLCVRRQVHILEVGEKRPVGDRLLQLQNVGVCGRTYAGLESMAVIVNATELNEELCSNTSVVMLNV